MSKVSVQIMYEQDGQIAWVNFIQVPSSRDDRNSDARSRYTKHYMSNEHLYRYIQFSLKGMRYFSFSTFVFSLYFPLSFADRAYDYSCLLVFSFFENCLYSQLHTRYYTSMGSEQHTSQLLYKKIQDVL